MNESVEHPAASRPPKATWSAGTIAGLYGLVASAWILGSDALLALVVSDPAWLTRLSVAKGWFFVAATAAMLYVLLRQVSGDRATPLASPASTSRAGRFWLLLLVAAITAMAVFATHRQHLALESARLEAVADLRARQVSQWLQERRQHAEFVADSLFFGELSGRIQRGEDPQAQEQLRARLDTFARTIGATGTALLLDARGEPSQGALADGVLGRAVRAAVTTGEVQLTPLRHEIDDAQSPLRMDMVAPLRLTGTPPRAVVILRLDPETTLLPLVRDWPVPSRTAQSGLVSRVGNTLVGVNGRRPMPITTPSLLAAKVVRGELPQGKAGSGTDYRGVPVVGAVRQLDGLEWYLVSRVDLAEVRAGGWADSIWVIATGLLAALGVLAVDRTARERAARREAAALAEEQSRTLRARAALAASEARLRMTVDRSPVGIADVSLDGRLLSANERLAQISGFPVQALQGMAISALTHPDDLAADEAQIARALAGLQDHFTLDKRYLRADGSTLWVNITATLVRDERGEPTGFLTAVQDIDERKRAEAALRERDALFSEMSALAHVGGWSWDARTQRGEWTEEVARIHAFAPNTLRSPAAALACFAGEHRQRLEQALDAALKRGEPYDLELQMTAQDGQAKWVRTVGLPHMEGGRLAHLHGYTQDVSARKHAELELEAYRQGLEQLVLQRTEQIRQAHDTMQAQAEQIEDLYNRAPVGYHSLDAEGRILSVNDTELDMLGWRRDELVGRLATDILLPPEAHAVFAKEMEKLRRGETVVLQPLMLCRREGGLLPVRVSVAPVLDDSGRLLRTRTVVVDDTERRLGEARIAALNIELERRADEAEAASRAKSAFLANMSHEIRTPMNAIIGLTQLVRRDTHEPRHVERLDKVLDAARHLLGIIDDVLDLSRVEAGKMQLQMGNFALQAVLDHLDSMLAQRARDKGLALALRAEGAPPWLMGDATRLTQALLNLLGNAIKFTEQGSVDLQVIELQRDGHRHCLRFEVRDTGPGIATGEQSRLFTAFEQLDASTTRTFGGTGLGLAITRHLAQLMGGEVGVQSTPGHGSLFWFSAWFEEGQAPAAQATSTAVRGSTAAAGARVLLVEDNAINREVAQSMLADLGLVVDQACDGQEAVAMAALRAYDLVLMDMRMPVMDGLEATRAIRALPMHGLTPIVAMTANAYEDDRRACLDAGMNDHLAKPVHFDSLQAMLTRWLPMHPRAPLTGVR
jgi:two-component system, sensor histidine kinase and response regulator